MLGQSISHYRILRKLGEGGMGVVYLAEDTILMRKVALKLLPSFLTTDEDAIERFKKEALAVAALNHPNIVTIYETNSFSGQHYLSLEFLEGETLREMLNKHDVEKLSLENIIDFSIQICSGLNKAHSAGIIHMDIKPENIFITKDNIVKILDFGVAGLIGSSSIHDEKNILGTAAYMSPEQLNGEAADNRTDIWSLGVLFYEMISGRLPFIGDYEQSVVYSVLNEEPAQINAANIPVRLKKIIGRCLKKTKDERFNSIEEIMSELKSVQKNLFSGPLSKHNENSEFRNIIESLSRPALEIYKPTEAFTGRESQLNIIKKKMEGIFNGRGTAILIQGEPGIGKTQLVYNAIYNSIPANLNILSGRCLYNESGFPYHPFASAVKNAYSLTAGVEAQFTEALLKYADKHGFSLSSRLPFIKSFLGFSGKSVSLLNKEQLWNAILMLFQLISFEEPLILIIDDLQWSDKTTLGLFSFIARNCSASRILLIGIHRPPEISSGVEKNESPLLETIRQLKIDGLAEQILLQRFNKEETGQLLVKILNSPPDPGLLENIFKNTEGNPLFISELVRLMHDKKYIKADEGMWHLEKKIHLKKEILITAKVQDVIHQRIDRLDSALREILEVASCEGEEFETEPLTACLSMDRISLLKNLSIIEKEHQLIRHEKNRYKFDHILIKEVLYRNILFELRQEYHKLISEYLIKKYGSNEEFSSKISHHLLASGNQEQAVAFLVLAANKARELHAAEDALNFYYKAAEILAETKSNDTPLIMNVEEGLGDIYLLMGSTDKALEKFERYLEISRSINNKSEECKALRKASEVYRVQGKIKEAYEYCTSALGSSKEAENKSELINCLNELAVIHASKGEYNSTIELSKQALNLAKVLNDIKSQSICFSNTGFAYWHMGIYLSALEYFNHAIGIQRSIGDNLGLSTTLNFLGMVYWKLGEYENALSSSFESLNIKKNSADIRKIPGTMNVIGDIYREVNDIERALEFHTRSLVLAKEHQNMGTMCDNIRDLGEDYFIKGDIELSRTYFEEALEQSKNSGLLWYETRTYISLSELYNFMGNSKKALYYSNLGLEFAKKINAKELIIETLWNQAKVKAGTENFDEIRKLFSVAIEIAESVGHKTFQWKLYKDFGKFLGDNGKDFEEKIYRNKAREILNKIIENLNEDLKRNFMSSENVKEVMKD